MVKVDTSNCLSKDLYAHDLVQDENGFSYRNDYETIPLMIVMAGEDDDYFLCTPDGVALDICYHDDDLEIKNMFKNPTEERIKRSISEAVSQAPKIAEHIPAKVYHVYPELSQEILTEYQKRVLEENASMGAGVDRTELVERVKREVAEMNKAFDIAEKSKPENLFADVTFDRTKK